MHSLAKPEKFSAKSWAQTFMLAESWEPAKTVTSPCTRKHDVCPPEVIFPRTSPAACAKSIRAGQTKCDRRACRDTDTRTQIAMPAVREQKFWPAKCLIDIRRGLIRKVSPARIPSRLLLLHFCDVRHGFDSHGLLVFIVR